MLVPCPPKRISPYRLLLGARTNISIPKNVLPKARPVDQSRLLATGTTVKKTFKQTWREDTKAVLFTALIGLILFSILEGERWKRAVNDRLSQLFNDKIIRNQELAAAISRIANDFTQQFTNNSRIKEDISARIREFVHSQGPTIRQALQDEVLNHPEFQSAAINWAKDQAVTVCNDPVTIDAMSDLITQATELPKTQEAVIKSIREVIENPDVANCAIDFVSKAIENPSFQNQIGNASQAVVDVIAQDPRVQATISNTLWTVLRRSMTPRWMWATEEIPKKSRRSSKLLVSPPTSE